MNNTRVIETFNEISRGYRALFFDVWGCLHNGIRPYGDTVLALESFIKTGGKVILLTNSPRPNPMTALQLDSIGVRRTAWHLLVTSGDAARASLFGGDVGFNVLHVGKSEELTFFTPDRSEPTIQRVPLEEAEGIVCTGPFPGQSTSISPYDDLLARARSMELPMLCVNPDLYVDRGGAREICAGLIARRYGQLGGRVLMFGKPRVGIYDLARKRLHELEPEITDRDILCVGDGIGTDIKGAIDSGLDSLFVTGGLAARETGTRISPDHRLLDKFINKHEIRPDYAIGMFR